MNKPETLIIQSDQPKKWQEILSDLITDPKDLLNYLQLDEAQRPASLMAQTQFPMKVPMPFAAKMRKADWDDPLLKQVWPATEEEIRVIRCQRCRYPACQVCSRPMPTGTRQRFAKSGQEAWTCTTCMVRER